MNWQAYGAVAVLAGGYIGYEIWQRARWRTGVIGGVAHKSLIADMSLVVFIVGSGLVWMLPDTPDSATGTLKVLLNILRFAAAGGMAVYGGNSSLARRRD
jgi:hypothetical protein